MNKLKSTNLIAGIALFTLIALPMVYVLSMPVAIFTTTGEFQSEYVLPFYSPVSSTLAKHPPLSAAYKPWLNVIGMDEAIIITMDVKNRVRNGETYMYGRWVRLRE